MERNVRWRVALLLLLAVSLAAGVASAQTTTGSIVGNLKDPSGALIPGAEVTAIETSTGVKRETISDDSGHFDLRQLPSGVYEVSIELPGFQKFVARRVRVQVRDTVRLDVTLQLGSPDIELIVDSAAARVDTQKSELGKVVSNKDIIDLPLNGRNALQLAALQPGVMPPEPGAVSVSNFSVNGQRGQNNNFLLEGGNNNDLAANFPTSNPNVEALQEFKVQSSSYDAEFGRNSGAQINAVIRTGGNQIHGTVYEFHRNDALDARNFFLPETEKLIRNQFGASAGGPIIKDKMFWFFSYEGRRDRTEAALTDALVPGAELRAGNVAGLLNDDGQEILDPDGDGRIEVNPISQRILDQFVPLPTGPVDPATGLGQLSSAVPELDDNDQYIAKGNYLFDGGHELSVVYLLNDNEQFDALAFGNPSSTVPGFGAGGSSRAQNAIISYFHNFSPTLLNNARFAYNRFSLFSVLPENGTDPNSLGFDGVAVQNGNFLSLPLSQVSGSFAVGASIQGPQGRGDDTFEVSDTVTWVRGDHSFKFGFNWTHFNQDQLFNFSNNGRHLFVGILGTPVVDFLAGASRQWLQGALPDLHFRQNSFSLFFNDEWRFNNRLSLNLGLRYEHFAPTTETGNKIGSVDFIGDRQIGMAQSEIFPNAPAGLLFPGDPGVERSTTATDNLNLAPRIGFAYDLTGDGRLALRGGYGIYYNTINTELQLQFLLTQPFGILSLVGAGGSNFAGGLLGGAISTPEQFAAPFLGQTNPFPFQSPNDSFFAPVDVTLIEPELTTPYSQQYSLSLQWEFIKDFVFEAAYVGSTGRNLLFRNLLNVVPFERNADNTVNVVGEGPLNPNINRNVTVQEASADSVYNSLQLSVNRRFSSGLGFLASYTYGHSIDNASGLRDDDIQDPFRPDLERGNSFFDIRQRFVFSGQYELPFGPGRRWGAGSSGVLGKLVEGWQVGGIFTADSGFPLSFGVAGNPTAGTLLDLGNRPNLAGDPLAGFEDRDIAQRGVDQGTTFFDTDAFSRCDDAGTPCFGNLSRTFLKGPGDWNVDLVILKRTAIPQISEVSNLEFRFEVFNLLNHANFDEPGQTLGTPTFGVITSLKGGHTPRQIQFALKLSF